MASSCAIFTALLTDNPSEFYHLLRKRVIWGLLGSSFIFYGCSLHPKTPINMPCGLLCVMFIKFMMKSPMTRYRLIPPPLLIPKETSTHWLHLKAFLVVISWHYTCKSSNKINFTINLKLAQYLRLFKVWIDPVSL